MPDTVRLAVGTCDEALVRPTCAKPSTLSTRTAHDAMRRPVATDSSNPSVRFAPDTLDLGVGNSESRQMASSSQHLRFHLLELRSSAMYGDPLQRHSC